MEMRSVARRWVQEYGVELIIVDYLQLVEYSEEQKRDNREQEVSRVSRGLKNIARELNVPVLALAHSRVRWKPVRSRCLNFRI